MSDNATKLQVNKSGDRSKHEDTNNTDQTEGYRGQLGKKRSKWGRSRPDLGPLLDTWNVKDKEGNFINPVGQETVQEKKLRIWKFMRPEMSDKLYDQYMARDLAQKDAELLVDKSSKTG